MSKQGQQLCPCVPQWMRAPAEAEARGDCSGCGNAMGKRCIFHVVIMPCSLPDRSVAADHVMQHVFHTNPQCMQSFVAQMAGHRAQSFITIPNQTTEEVAARENLLNATAVGK